MNAMMWIPGPRRFRRLPEGWRWDVLEPYLRRVERDARAITPLVDPNPMSEAYLESVAERTWPNRAICVPRESTVQGLRASPSAAACAAARPTTIWGRLADAGISPS